MSRDPATDYVPDAENIAFIAGMFHRFPMMMPVLQEHLEDMGGEVLSHLLIADVVRWLAARVIEHGDDDTALLEILQAMEDQFGRGDPVDELIAVSFVENLPSIGERGVEIRSLLGPKLKAQLRLWEGA